MTASGCLAGCWPTVGTVTAGAAWSATASTSRSICMWRDQSELRRAAQRESAAAAARLDEIVADVEAARSVGRTDS